MSTADVAETTAPILHLRGPILLGPEEELAEAWVAGGVIHHEKPELPAGTEVREIDGIVVPGLADLHCHLGIADGGGGTTLAEAREQALVDRDTGVLLVRDAGSIIDNRPLRSFAGRPKSFPGRNVNRIEPLAQDFAFRFRGTTCQHDRTQSKGERRCSGIPADAFAARYATRCAGSFGASSIATVRSAGAKPAIALRRRRSTTIASAWPARNM